ncbi:MAG: hypothetical protein QXD77_00100 [Candidatus Aenigmatarchaeota archaeon]
MRAAGGKAKGTVWYFSDIAVAITSLMGTLFMLFVAALMMFVLSSQLDVNVLGVLMYAAPKTDNMLLTYLDSTADGHPMKELLAYAELAGNDTFELDGKTYDIKAESAALMGRITDRAYTLKLRIGETDVKLASVGKAEAMENLQSEAMVQGGGMSGKLTLTVAKSV